MIRRILAATLLIGSTTAYADGGPTPPKEAKDMQCLVGSWTGRGTVEMGEHKIPVAMTYDCQESSGGFGVACTGVITGIPGMPRYVTQDLWGLDPGEGAVHWFTVTNAGETHDHKGTIGKNYFRGQYVGKREGKNFVEKVDFTFKNENKMTVECEGLVEGKRVERVRVTLEKKNARAARR